MDVLNAVKAIVGIAAGLITIYAFVDGRNYLDGFSASDTVLLVHENVQLYGQRWTPGVLLTGILVCVIEVVIFRFMDDWDYGPEIFEALNVWFYCAPFAAAFLWIYGNVLTYTGVTIFVLAYLLIPVAIAVAKQRSDERRSQKTSLVGRIKKVSEHGPAFLKGHKVYRVLLELTTGEVVQVRYSDSVPPKVGQKIQAFGEWEGGLYKSHRFDMAALDPDEL